MQNLQLFVESDVLCIHLVDRRADQRNDVGEADLSDNHDDDAENLLGRICCGDVAVADSRNGCDHIVEGGQVQLTIGYFIISARRDPGLFVVQGTHLSEQDPQAAGDVVGQHRNDEENRDLLSGSAEAHQTLSEALHHGFLSTNFGDSEQFGQLN